MKLPEMIAILTVVVSCAALGLVAASRKSRDGLLNRPWPLDAKRQLLTERERVLFGRLREALPNHIVLAQVQLLQILEFRSRQRDWGIFNRISRLSIDFLVLNADTSIVAAIELDDATHARQDRRQADARKSHALKSAGIRLIRWQARSLPDLPSIKADITPVADIGPIFA